jgi:diguanylate cyclase (GGDEF)-like protein/PAS domain S-box-containing protein
MNEQLILEKLTAKNRSLESQIDGLLCRERELLDYKQQIDAIFENAPVELYLKDKEGRYLKINKQFEKIFGVKNDDLIGKFPTDAHDPDLARYTRQQDLTVLSTGEIQRSEDKALLVTDDRIHTLLTIKFPVFDRSGEVNGLGAIVTDITDQKQTEDRFRDIVDTIDGIVWEYDISTSAFTYVSHQAEDILGYARSAWITSGFWESTMHPDDHLWVPDYSRKCIEENLDKYEIEYRIMAKDGRIVWVRILISVIRENGSPRWLRGLLINITQRKEAEEAAKETESQFRTMFMSAPVGMLLIDLKTTNLREINLAYTKIVGRSVTEIKKMGWQKITHPDDLAENTHNLKMLQEGKQDSFKMLKRFIKPDNSIVWTELTVHAIENQSNPANLRYLAILEDVTARKGFEEKIWHQANFDFLTGLPNRGMLHDNLLEAIKTSSRDDAEFALLFIDLDQFKDINDTLGHDKGDELLIDASSRIKRCALESSTVARLGGDEFVVIVSEPDDSSDVAATIAQDIIRALANPFHLDKHTAYISASIGITLYPKDGTSSIDLMRNADQAMYAAKNHGRNGYYFFEPAMQQAAQQRMLLTNDLRDAIKNEEFVLYYQPIVELGGDEIFKAEALIRWQHPERGLISPMEFIPVAEETRMIIQIGDWVLQEATKQNKLWQTTLRKGFQVNVNASPIQFESSANFSWQSHLSALETSAPLIGIEITESLLMTSDKSALNTLLEFRDAGIQVSLDDFGTGYSSLSYLRKFDIDYLKIDRSFVHNLDHGSDELALCSAIIVMAHKLGIKVIAEGIETQLQKDLLMAIDCDFGQGFLFSKPIPAHEFEQLVLSSQSGVDIFS